MFHKTEDLWPRGEAPAQAFCGEDQRLAVLAAHGTKGLVDDPELNGIVALVAEICAAPIAMVTMVERDRQVFLSRLGLDETETPRPTSFCAHAMLGSEAMVVRDATEDPRFADNALVTGPPHVRFYAGHPLISSEGAPLGALCVIDTVPRPLGLTGLQQQALAVLAAAVMRRIGQRRMRDEAQAEVDRREYQLLRMLDSVPGVAFSADEKGNFDYFNAQWVELTGAPAPGTAAEWVPFVHEEDYPAAMAQWEKAVQSTVPFEAQWRLKLADGDWRWVLSRCVPITVEGGPVRWFGVLTDIDAVHREQQAKDLIAAELSHRIKNIFAVVSGLVAIRSRGKPEVAEYAQELGAAIRALGTAHEYVRPIEGRVTERLQGLLRDLLAPYDHGGAEQIRVTGADIELGVRAATPLALIFHELATNSAKYGALASAEGTVTVEIGDPYAADGMLHVNWRESTPGQVTPSSDSNEGFGSRLLRLAIESQLGGSFYRTIGSDGISIEIVVPRKRITD